MFSDTTMTTTTWYYFSQQCKYWFDAWSGGAVDDVHQQLILFGGGHDDSENDMVLTLGLSGTPAWRRFKDPTVPVPYPDSQNWEGLQPYFVRAADGGIYRPGASPSSRHTYGGLQYVPSQNKLYAFGGSVAHGGMMSTELWSLDMSSGSWTLTSPYGRVPGGSPTTAYNPSNGHVVMHDNNWSLYDYNPASNSFTLLTNNANVSNTYHSAAAIDPVHNYFVIVSSGGGSAPAYDYYPGTPGQQIVRGFDLSGSDRYATHTWDDPSCNLITAYTGLQWDSALGLLVGYPGGGNRVFFLNAGPTSVSTSYGTVPSHKCLNVTIGTQKGVDYPQDPEMQNGSYFTGLNQRFAYFPSLDVFALVNRISSGAGAWILRLAGGTGQPNLTVSDSPASLTLAQGSWGTSTITTAISGGFNNAVNLAASGAPAGTAVAFNPSTILAPGAGTSTMTITVGTSTAAGTYPITVTASGGGLAPTTTFTLTVTLAQGPNLSVSASPSSLSVNEGNQGTTTVTTAISGGFNNTVNLSATGAPAGTTVSFNPSTILAPGAGTSAMTITVGTSTTPGSYPIIVTAAGGGLAPTTTVTLTVTSQSGWQQGFDFRATAGYVTDPPYTNYVLASTAYPTTMGGVTYGWVNTSLLQSSNRSTQVDPRLGGINYVRDGSPGTFYVDLPSAGTYNVSLAMGDEGYGQCWHLCQVQFLDGSTVLATVGGGPTRAGYFYDALGSNWAAATWPEDNLPVQVTMAGTRLTVVVGSSTNDGYITPIAYLGLSQGSGSGGNFGLTAAPGALTIAQGNQGSSTITSTISGGFNNAISLTSSGAPAGTTVSFNPSTIPAPGAGTSAMTITVGSTTAPGTYPITVTGTGGGVRQTTTVTLTVTLNSPPDFTLTAAPTSLTIAQGNQGSSTITTTISGGFNNAISLTSSGAPAGTTVSFNPSTIPAPGAGTSTMTIAVGTSTAPGTYPITVTGNGGGDQHNATVTLTVTSQSAWQQGFDFRATAGYVTDPPHTNYVLATTAYPTTMGGVTYGWANTSLLQSSNRSTQVDPRLGGVNYVRDGSPGTFYVDLPSAGTYSLALAMGDEDYGQCWRLCQVQFLDGSTVLATVSGGPTRAGYFYDALGSNWAAATWPGNNLPVQVTMAGTRLTVVLGSSTNDGYITPIAYLGLSQGSGSGGNFALTAAPGALTIAQGNQGNSTITSTISGGFNNAISLTSSGAPAGTTVSFNPSTIPAPGAGTSAMTIAVGASTAPGTYPITVTGNGGGVRQSTTVTLTVSLASQPDFTLTAAPTSLTVAQGNQGSSTITTTISGGFNNAITLTSSGAPAGTTVGFNPSTIPAPGAGTSAMTITVGTSTAPGTYPITVTGNGGGDQHNATVTLTVTNSTGVSGNGITVTDLSGSGQNNRFVSLGRFFKQGDIPHFAQAVVNGNPLLTQCDVKNRWPDGSLKFAIISFILPTVSTGGTAVTFQDQGTGNNTDYLTQSNMLDPAYDFEGVMQLTGTACPSISARAMLQAGHFRYWLQGPIVTAVIIEDRDGRSNDVETDGAAGNPLHPIFEAWFYPQGHKVELGFTLENSWASSTGTRSARNQTFALSITTGNTAPATRLTQASFTQWAFTRWRRSFWLGSDPAPIQFNFNPQYLVTTGAYPAYDPNYMPPTAGAVNAEYSVYTSQTTTSPALLTIPGIDNVSGNGGIVDYAEYLDSGGDPTHGSWIGLFPTWDIYYLLTGDARIQKMMTDNADLAARFPMWFREADHNAGTGHYFDYPGSGSVDPYGHVVSINARQQVPLLLSQWNAGTGSSNNQCTGGAGDDIRAGAALSYGGWQALGTSHLPDFAYIPYTLTGKYYYLEQEMMEDGYVAGFYTGCYNLSQSYWRQGYLGLMQWGVRDQAWALRSLAFGAFISPDGDPEGPYFEDKLLNNIARLEGEHGLTLDITDTSDRTTAYTWGHNVAQESQAANPSPLGAFDVDSAAYSYAQNGYENNVNPNTLKAAGSMFQEAFMNVALGLARQMGVANTRGILTWEAKRPFHMLLDPSVNHYLIGQYCYPSQYTNGTWVADWPNFQANYLTLPTGWGGVGSTDDVRGFQQMSGVSFMTDITVDGINGQAVWTWFKANKPNQSEFQTTDPRWSITPLH